ncbi:MULTISPECIES: hypothetical protein [unclassified Sphingomonas]|uniref:hypothetical protein n=1 Tax=unclassified Sphingomonas TaxID=196159 RepID=UPI00226AA0FF|nr:MULTISPECIES: hypothetical protein [unclassified Sphingomonas]
MKLPVELERLLVAALVVSEGDLDRRLTAHALLKRYSFGRQPSGWIIDGVKELGSLGLLVDYNRDGTDEDQFVQLTSSGAAKALRLVNAGFTLRMTTPHSDGSTFSDGSSYATEVLASELLTGADQTAYRDTDTLRADLDSEAYQAISRSFSEAIEKVAADNAVEGRELILTDLRYAQSLWERGEFKRIQFKAAIALNVELACEKIVEGYSSLALHALLTLLQSFAATAWGIHF